MEVFLAAVELGKFSFCLRPEAFNTVDLNAVSDMFRFVTDFLFDTQILIKADPNQSVIAAPSIADDNTFDTYLATYNAL